MGDRDRDPLIAVAAREPLRRSRVVPKVVGAYAAVTGVALVIGLLRGHVDVLACVPLWRAPGGAWVGHAVSVAAGTVLALVVIGATRWLVRTQSWAAALHEDLRPIARALGRRAILPVALASAIGEETLFRGALVPAIGVVASSVLFGALHQLRGRSRWTWVVFATAVGLALAVLFRTTGSLLGPVVAHALVNAANLRFLVTHDTRRVPRLGGLLAGLPSRRTR